MIKIRQLLPGLVSLAVLSPLTAMADTESGAPVPTMTQVRLSPDMLGMDSKLFIKSLPPQENNFRPGTLKSDTAFDVYDDNCGFTMPFIGTLTNIQYVFSKGDSSVLTAYSGDIVKPMLSPGQIGFNGNCSVYRTVFERAYGKCEIDAYGIWWFKRDPNFSLSVQIKQRDAATVLITVIVSK